MHYRTGTNLTFIQWLKTRSDIYVKNLEAHFLAHYRKMVQWWSVYIRGIGPCEDPGSVWIRNWQELDQDVSLSAMEEPSAPNEELYHTKILESAWIRNWIRTWKKLDQGLTGTGSWRHILSAMEEPLAATCTRRRHFKTRESNGPSRVVKVILELYNFGLIFIASAKWEHLGQAGELTGVCCWNRTNKQTIYLPTHPSII